MVDFRKEDDIVCTSREKLEKFIRELLRLTTLVNTRMSYDIPQIMNRLIYLGEDPKYYFCHKDFKRHMLQYNYDNLFKNDFKNKNESFDCTSYTMYVDQMLHYAGIRKANADYGGTSLDNVAHIELGAEKRRYSKPTITVLNGAIEEYWNFVLYNINDVLLQYGIDLVTDDMNVMFDQSLYGCTRLSKTLKQSVYLKNVWAIEYFQLGIVPGNNINVSYTENKSEEYMTDLELYESMRPPEGENTEEDYDEIKLAGALVGNPQLNDFQGVALYGKDKSMYMYSYAIDFDYTAEYPNAKRTANIASNTQYGRLIIKDQVLPDENPDKDPLFMRAGKFIEDYETGDASLIGKWLSLPSSYEVSKGYGERLRKKSITSNGRVRIAPSNIHERVKKLMEGDDTE